MATTTNYSWTTPDDTALVKDGAAAIRSLGTAIDTTVFNNAGAAIAKTLLDAKGDLIVASAADTAARLAVGTNGYILTANSGATNGIEWAAPAAGGKVLQVVSTTYSTPTTVASTTYADTGLSLSITPTSATSKVLVLISQSHYSSRDGKYTGMALRLLRDATAIYTPSPNRTMSQIETDGVNITNIVLHNLTSITYLDSPATTSATTYKTQQAVFDTSNSGSSQTQQSNSVSSIILLEIGA